MTRDETKRIIFLIANTYPNFKPADMSVTVDIWTKLFEEYPYEECERALHTYMSLDTSGFAPVPGQIIEKMHVVETITEKTTNEVWSEIRLAIGDSIYHAKERFEELSPEAQKAVGSPNNLKNWAEDMEYNDNVVQSLVIRNLETVRKRQREYDRLPLVTKKLIAIAEQERFKQELLECKEATQETRVTEPYEFKNSNNGGWSRDKDYSKDEDYRGLYEKYMPEKFKTKEKKENENENDFYE